MRSPLTWIRWCLAAAFAVAVMASPLTAQQPVGEVTVTPVSDLYPDAFNQSAESPNGRFVLAGSYASESFLRYDRITRQWASNSSVSLGREIRWSPDGRFLAFSWRPENMTWPYIWVLPMDSSTGMPSGTQRRISTRSGSWPAWSPDGRRVAFLSLDSSRFRILTVPFNGGEEEVLYDAPGSGGGLAWSPDGRHVWVGYGPGGWGPGTRNYSLRVNTVTRRVDTLPPGGGPLMLGYSPDGEMLAHFYRQTSTLVISASADGHVIQKIRLPNRIAPVGWSRSIPNAFTAFERVVPTHFERVSLPEGTIESLTPLDSTGPDGVVYSPDGRQIAIVRLGRVHVANGDGTGLRAVGNRGDIDDYRWSPTGRHIAYLTQGAIGTIHVVDVATGTDRELVRSTATTALFTANFWWRRDGQAVRYISRHLGPPGPEREVREAGLDQTDSLIVVLATMNGNPQLINDTLLLLQSATGIDAVSLRTGALRPLYTGSTHGGEFGLSKDGTWLAFSADDAASAYPRLLSLATGETRRIPYPLQGELSTVIFHPDGRHLIAMACLTCKWAPEYTEKWDIVLLPINGDPPRVLTASQSSYKDFWAGGVSPDGRYVVFQAQQSYNTRVVTLTLPMFP